MHNVEASTVPKERGRWIDIPTQCVVLGLTTISRDATNTVRLHLVAVLSQARSLPASHLLIE